MGGHALSVDTTRLTDSNYTRLVSEISEKLKGYAFEVIPAYFQKPDFGDMDILFESEGFDPYAVSKLLNATEVVRNGDVTSIGVELESGVFQVDLISVPKEVFNFALNYFSFNDLGNLIGRVAHKAGFKFGHKGLLYVFRDERNPDQVIDELTVTTSFKDALEFCGYSFENYEKGRTGGFQTLEDVFKFVISSQYFNKDIFLLDNRNAKARVRDSKRKTYMSFLKFSENINSPAFDYSNKLEFRKEMYGKALELFHEFKVSIICVIDRHFRQKRVAERFNGDLVKEVTGLNGKELGSFIQSFKKSFEDFENFILSSTKEEIVYNLKSFNYMPVSASPPK